MIAGTGYANDDAEFKSLIQMVDFLHRSLSISGNLREIFPVLKKIAPGLCGHTNIMKAVNDLKDFFRVVIIIYHDWMYQYLTESLSNSLICS
jgi:hypothetical protein